MIGYLRGEIAHISEDNLILDVNGVGYNVIITSKTAEKVAGAGSEITIYTYLSVREDAMKLYGFIDSDELLVENNK